MQVPLSCGRGPYNGIEKGILWTPKLWMFSGQNQSGNVIVNNLTVDFKTNSSGGMLFYLFIPIETVKYYNVPQ